MRLDSQKLLWRPQVQASDHHSQARAGAEGAEPSRRGSGVVRHQ
jgi:hypothetical protein